MHPHASRGIQRFPAILLGSLAVGTCLGASNAVRPARAGVPVAGLLRRASACFVRNQGQSPAPVKYYVRGDDRTVYFAPDGLTLSLAVPEPKAGANDTQDGGGTGSMASRYAVKLDFVAADSIGAPVGEDPLTGKANFLTGGTGSWTRGVTTYAGLRYRELWSGIDLAYRGSDAGLKYEFRLRPGADSAAIRLAFRGARSVRVNDAGQLVVDTPAGSFTDEAPVTYQEVDGRRVPVASGYEVTQRPDGAWEYGFRLGNYDHSRPLVIDPALLIYCGYLGGSAQDLAAGVAVDGQGNAYVAGYTYSTETTFPVQAGFDSTANGSVDAFIAKVGADGAGFDYCTYLGGLGDDTATCIAIDPDGRACVGGRTTSTEITFPVVTGPVDTYADNGDGWVARLKADGSGLDFCGYVGGDASDEVTGIAADAGGHVFITGNTLSDETSFPTAVGPDLTQNGELDGFVARLSDTGVDFDYCGFIGGDNWDLAFGAALAPNGELGVVGRSSSLNSSFPVVAGPDLTRNDEEAADAYIALVKADGSGLTYCGYVGGANIDTLYAVTFDQTGAAYAVGGTDSNELTFPVLGGPDLSHSQSGDDAFIVKVNPSGTALQYCGYIGGAGNDEAYSVAVDEGGNAYVAGVTQAKATTFPVRSGPDARYRGGFQDGFIARVKSNGTGLDYCGYVGGAETDFISGVAVDADGNAYVVGSTGSHADSFPVRNGPISQFSGGSTSELSDAFIAKVGAYTGPVGSPGRLVVPAKRLQAGTVKLGKSKSVKLKIKNTGAGSVHLNVPALAAPFTTAPAGNLLLPPRQTQVITVTYSPTMRGAVVGGLAITSDDPLAPLSIVPLAGKGK